MPKNAIRITVRIVDRPNTTKPDPSKPYQPPKAQVFKAIAECTLNGKSLSRNAVSTTESQARLDAFDKLATLVAKQGDAFPVKGPGVEDTP
tara:strand:+ start:219 stop:491 length:273 start_codon:yes stop_codon:yes gene_type:complete